MPIEPVILTPPEISCLRRSCSLAREALHSVARPLVRAGVTTEAIDDAVRAFVLASGAYPSPLNFDGFPKSVSTSVNDVAGHGIPDDRPLEPGDVVNVDVTVYLDGFHGDTSATFVVPGGDPEAAEWAYRLVSAATECLYAGVAACGPDEPFLRIGHAISKLSKRRHVRVVPQLGGHGIGRQLMRIAGEQAREHGYDRLSLVVFEENAVALRLYRDLGYEIIDRAPIVPHPLIRCSGDALLMVASPG